MPEKITVYLFCLFCLVTAAQAQFATIGGGALLSSRPAEAVAEINVQSAPFFQSRAYLTMSWTKHSAKPTLITAAEYGFLQLEGIMYSNIGAGFLWLENNDYNPYTMLLSSTIMPLPVPGTSFVVIGSLLPFQDYDWSVLVKLAWAFWFSE